MAFVHIGSIAAQEVMSKSLVYDDPVVMTPRITLRWRRIRF